MESINITEAGSTIKGRVLAFYINIYFKIIAQDIKSKMSYRADFIISTVGMIATNIAGFIAFLIMFGKFPSINGWGYYEILFLYGFSRSSEELANQLQKDNYPILCEGLHTTAILNDNRLKDRMIFVRAHNVEHDYYRALGKSEHSLWKRVFYLAESVKLRHYEPVLAKAKGIFAIAQQDFDYFSKRYGKTILLPGFNAQDSVCSESGRGRDGCSCRSGDGCRAPRLP